MLNIIVPALLAFLMPQVDDCTGCQAGFSAFVAAPGTPLFPCATQTWQATSEPTNGTCKIVGTECDQNTSCRYTGKMILSQGGCSTKPFLFYKFEIKNTCDEDEWSKLDVEQNTPYLDTLEVTITAAPGCNCNSLIKVTALVLLPGGSAFELWLGNYVFSCNPCNWS